MENRETVREFDKFAASYKETLDDPLRRWFTQEGVLHFHQRKFDLLCSILKERKLNPNEITWVDVGCGRGDLLKLGKPFFSCVTGCDVSREMLAQGGNLDLLHQADPHRLPFADATADMASAVCIFHHVEEQDRAPLMLEIVRVLKPGGLLALIEHNPFNPVTQWIVKRSPVDANAHLLTPGRCRKLMLDTGLRFEGIDYFLYLPEKLHARFVRVEGWLRNLPFGGQYLALGRKSPTPRNGKPISDLGPAFVDRTW